MINISIIKTVKLLIKKFIIFKKDKKWKNNESKENNKNRTVIVRKIASKRKFSINSYEKEFITDNFHFSRPDGVVFTTIGKLGEDFRSFGGVFAATGIIFLIAGVYLVFGLAMVMTKVDNSKSPFFPTFFSHISMKSVHFFRSFHCIFLIE